MIRYCRTRDGVSIAYTVAGSGPALVLVGGSANLGNIPSVFDAYRTANLKHHTEVRYNMRGSGYSDRPDAQYSLDDYLLDLEAVVDALGLDRFDLFGETSGGCISIAYAARHPRRVARLVVLGTPARPLPARNPGAQLLEQRAAMLAAMRAGWDRGPEVFRQIFISQMAPGASRQQTSELCEVYGATFGAADVERFVTATANIDVTALAPCVACPTLVVHSRRDLLVPFDEGRLLAGLIPDARLFVIDDSPNRFPLPDEPAFARLQAELRGFFGTSAPFSGPGSQFARLSPRDRTVLELVARGLDNHQIAARLDRSEKTVRNTVAGLLKAVEVESRAQLIIRSRAAGFGCCESLPGGR